MDSMIRWSCVALLLLALLPSVAQAQSSNTPGLRDALRKTTGATTYRALLRGTVTGLLPELRAALGDTRANPRPEDPLTLATAVYDIAGQDTRTTQESLALARLLGLKPGQAVELILARSTLYLHGPLPALGATRDSWYRAERLSARRRGASDPLLDTLENAGDLQSDLEKFQLGDLSWLRRGRDEQLGQLRCTAYASDDRRMALGGLQALGLDPSATITPGMVVKSAKIALWACEDGYMRQIRAELAVADPARPRRLVTFVTTVQIDGFGTNPAVVVPASSLALPAASVRPTPTPQPPGTQTATPTAPPAQTPGPSATSLATPAGGQLIATVVNGGNVRDAPAISGRVVEQVNARETVTLLARSADSSWYQVVTPRGVTGWISRTLLSIAPQVAQAVPVQSTSP